MYATSTHARRGDDDSDGDELSYDTDDALDDILEEQNWFLAWDAAADSNAAKSGSDYGVTADGKLVPAKDNDNGRLHEENVATNVVSDSVIQKHASSCSPEDLASKYAVEDVIAALVRWHCDDHGVGRNQDVKTDPLRNACKVEEMLFRRNVSIHSTITRMDMAAKRQVLSAMRQQPHTQDAILPWLGASVSQVCSYQLMSKGLPTYAPGQPASNRAQQIINAVASK